MRFRAVISTLAPACVAVWSCYPGQVISVPQLSAIVTLVDSGAALHSARTFSVLDSIALVDREDGGLTVSRNDGAAIVTRIRAELIAKGWREVDFRTQRPDVAVLASVFVQENTGVAFAGWWPSYAYWGGWPAGYGPSWGWGMPGAEVTFTFDSGTLAVVMLDLRNGDTAAQRVPALWAAAINGVITSEAPDGALAGISQAFLQSPYLERP